MNTQQEKSENQQENDLRLEIEQLKKDLQKEEFFHKTIYKQWMAVNARMLAKERELKQFKTKNLLYKYTFYLILFSVAPAFYFLSTGKRDERNAVSSETVLPSPAKINHALTTNKIQVANVNPGKKEVIQPDNTQPKVATINKPVIEEEFPDSVRYMIYWDGWTAYYQKEDNPYQKSSKKYEIWLNGWKEAENDVKKLLTNVSSDTLSPLLGSATRQKP